MKRALCALAFAWLIVVPVEAGTCSASWYGYESGRTTATGARFHPDLISAAHRTLPFGTHVRVSWRGRSVVVIVTDRGPAAWTGRCIDLSRGAAVQLHMLGAGVARVTIEAVR